MEMRERLARDEDTQEFCPELDGVENPDFQNGFSIVGKER